jgi:hypothetical protein
MTTAVTIRPCRPDEIPAILDARRRAEAIPGATDTPADLKRLLRHDADALLVALADDRIVATAIVTWDGWRGGIGRRAGLEERNCSEIRSPSREAGSWNGHPTPAGSARRQLARRAPEAQRPRRAARARDSSAANHAAWRRLGAIGAARA